MCDFSVTFILKEIMTFYFERNYYVSKSKSRYILLKKNINFHKSETETKMENRTHSFREMNLALQKLKVKL